MVAYRNVQTGPKSQFGGVHEGFFNVGYLSETSSKNVRNANKVMGDPPQSISQGGTTRARARERERCVRVCVEVATKRIPFLDSFSGDHRPRDASQEGQSHGYAQTQSLAHASRSSSSSLSLSPSRLLGEISRDHERSIGGDSVGFGFGLGWKSVSSFVSDYKVFFKVFGS
mmetsp:Transcript_919/g.2720  ORF Transcript_919/g.2720 Transcript_919/m.2720 type:complete len:171 (-) Transcript_919:59-571(-)